MHQFSSREDNNLSEYFHLLGFRFSNFSWSETKNYFQQTHALRNERNEHLLQNILTFFSFLDGFYSIIITTVVVIGSSLRRLWEGHICNPRCRKIDSQKIAVTRSRRQFPRKITIPDQIPMQSTRRKRFQKE